VLLLTFPLVLLPILLVMAPCFLVSAFYLSSPSRSALSARMHAERRRDELARSGVHAEAEVVAVGALDSHRPTEVPFTLRYRSPDGREHLREFTEGFKGIVPSPGWRVRVSFLPGAPGDAEITENPYLHPVPGTPAPKPSRPLPRFFLPALIAAAVVLYGVLAFFYDPGGSGPASLLGGAFWTAAGLGLLPFGVLLWRSETCLRGPAAHTPGTVTHSWQETRHVSGPNERPSRRVLVHHYAVHYVLPDGRQVHRRNPHPAQKRYRAVGEQVNVAYDPARPTVFSAEGAAISRIPALFILCSSVGLPLMGTANAAGLLFGTG